MEKHFAVSGFVLNESQDKVLMVYHKKLNVWVIPGGHLEANEYPFEGAKREILEETGVEVGIIDSARVSIPESKKESQVPNPIITLSEYIPAKGDKPEHIHMDLIFLARADEAKTLKAQEAEVKDVRWMSLEEVNSSNTFESVKSIARIYLKGGEEKCESSDS